MADTSRVGLYMVEEVTWGTTPASALTELRKTSVNFKPIIETTRSQEIISDAQVRDSIKTGEAAEGDIGTELSYGSYDKLYEGLLRATWPAAVTQTASTISAASADNSFNDSGSGFVTAGFVPGQFIRTSGFTNAANNGYFVVVSVAAGKMVVVGATLVVEAAGTSRTIKGTALSNGTTAKSYTIEQTFLNEAGTTHFLAYKGMRVGSAGFEFAPASIATGSFNFTGRSATSAAATAGTGAAVAPTTTDVMNAVGDVKFMQENGAAIQVTSVQMNVENELRRKEAVGTAGAIGIGQGQFVVSGSITLYLEDRTLIDKAIAQTASSFAWVVADAAGNAYGFHIPRLKFGQPDMPVGGNSQDIMLTLPFEGLRSPTLAKTLYLTRIPA
jgi:hypothetical protein